MKTNRVDGLLGKQIQSGAQLSRMEFCRCPCEWSLPIHLSNRDLLRRYRLSGGLFADWGRSENRQMTEVAEAKPMASDTGLRVNFLEVQALP